MQKYTFILLLCLISSCLNSQGSGVDCFRGRDFRQEMSRFSADSLRIVSFGDQHYQKNRLEYSLAYAKILAKKGFNNFVFEVTPGFAALINCSDVNKLDTLSQYFYHLEKELYINLFRKLKLNNTAFNCIGIQDIDKKNNASSLAALWEIIKKYKPFISSNKLLKKVYKTDRSRRLKRISSLFFKNDEERLKLQELLSENDYNYLMEIMHSANFGFSNRNSIWGGEKYLNKRRLYLYDILTSKILPNHNYIFYLGASHIYKRAVQYEGYELLSPLAMLIKSKSWLSLQNVKSYLYFDCNDQIDINLWGKLKCENNTIIINEKGRLNVLKDSILNGVITIDE